MKKLFLFFAAVLLTAISSNLFAQGVQQTTIINSTRNYWVNSTDGTTQDVAGHTGSTYQWAVYDWDGAADYTATAWAAVAATSGTDYSFPGSSTDFNTSIKWLAAGDYVVEVVETNQTAGCTTVRRFGVKILDLDLLVETIDHTTTTLAADATYCNTNEGDLWGDSHDDDLNNESLSTMTMTYEISLYTVKGSSNAADLIGTALNTAAWRFTVADASTIPAAGNVTWTVTNGTVSGGGSFTTGANNVIEVAAGTSTVTITAEIKNIAAVNTDQYALDMSITPATVQIENGGASATDYAEGQEPDAYDGVTDAASHTNSAFTITVNPIPNTTKIKFN